MGGMGGIGRMIKDAGKLVGKKKKRKPPKSFNAMTEGRKVGQAKEKIEAKKKRDKKFSDIGKFMVATLEGSREKKVPQKVKDAQKFQINPKKPKRPTAKTGSGKMGGGKVYTSMDKKYGGGIFPRKGKM